MQDCYIQNDFSQNSDKADGDNNDNDGADETGMNMMLLSDMMHKTNVLSCVHVRSFEIRLRGRDEKA